MPASLVSEDLSSSNSDNAAESQPLIPRPREGHCSGLRVEVFCFMLNLTVAMFSQLRLYGVYNDNAASGKAQFTNPEQECYHQYAPGNACPGGSYDNFAELRNGGPPDALITSSVVQYLLFLLASTAAHLAIRKGFKTAAGFLFFMFSGLSSILPSLVKHWVQTSGFEAGCNRVCAEEVYGPYASLPVVRVATLDMSSLPVYGFTALLGASGALTAMAILREQRRRAALTHSVAVGGNAGQQPPDDDDEAAHSPGL